MWMKLNVGRDQFNYSNELVLFWRNFVFKIEIQKTFHSPLDTHGTHSSFALKFIDRKWRVDMRIHFRFVADHKSVKIKNSRDNR